MILLISQYHEIGSSEIYYFPNDFLTDQERNDLVRTTEIYTTEKRNAIEEKALWIRVRLILTKLLEFSKVSSRSLVFEGVDQVIYLY